jgi:alpha-L-fucosidase
MAGKAGLPVSSFFPTFGAQPSRLTQFSDTVMRLPKLLFLGLSALALLLTMRALAAPPDSALSRDGRMAWWRDARFGMFIHWGVYSIPARGEWVMNTEKIPVKEYEKFPPQFNPVKFNAEEWVRIAKDAGMKYIVITSKHHDGFCMWDSKVSSYDIMDATPFKRDVLAELAAACKKEGMTLGFYHSIMDWHHPDENKENFAEYREKYLKPQLKELLTRYGNIAVLWFDGEWVAEWTEDQGKELERYIRTVSPNVVINNRISKARAGMNGMSNDPNAAGDFGTPEQEIPATGVDGVDWESCMTLNDHWGYAERDHNWKSPGTLVRNIIDIASKGGNYLLNVGPQPDGLIPDASVSILKKVGGWMGKYGESIYGTQASPIPSTPWGRCTRKSLGDGRVRLYFHLFGWPAAGKLVVPGLGLAPVKASLVGAKQAELPLAFASDVATVTLPPASPDSIVGVVALDFPSEPVIFRSPEIVSPASFFTDSLTVSVTTKQVKGIIHYTTDGTEPVVSSPVVSAPLVMKKATNLKARTFLGTRGVAETVEASFDLVSPSPGAAIAHPVPGLAYTYIEGTWSVLPDFSTITAVARGTAAAIDLSPKKRDEYFALSFDGYILIPSTGTYMLTLKSDDGSSLFIDGKKVVDNDGLHGSTDRTGSAALGKGYHRIRVEYFNQAGSAELALMIARTGEAPHTVTANELFSAGE